MAIQFRLVVLGLLLLATTSCGRAFGSYEPSTTPVDQQELVLPLRYLDSHNVGPEYTVRLTVPAEWVGQFVADNNGNEVSFDYTQGAGGKAPIFTISALSEQQYWEQIGSYPGIYKSVLSTGETYFIYFLPRDAFHSGLPAETYAALAEQVPGIITTFEAQLAQ
jgi:hypothetical protein